MDKKNNNKTTNANTLNKSHKPTFVSVLSSMDAKFLEEDKNLKNEIRLINKEIEKLELEEAMSIDLEQERNEIQESEEFYKTALETTEESDRLYSLIMGKNHNPQKDLINSYKSLIKTTKQNKLLNESSIKFAKSKLADISLTIKNEQKYINDSLKSMKTLEQRIFDDQISVSQNDVIQKLEQEKASIVLKSSEKINGIQARKEKELEKAQLTVMKLIDSKNKELEKAKTISEKMGLEKEKAKLQAEKINEKLKDKRDELSNIVQDISAKKEQFKKEIRDEKEKQNLRHIELEKKFQNERDVLISAERSKIIADEEQRFEKLTKELEQTHDKHVVTLNKQLKLVSEGFIELESKHKTLKKVDEEFNERRKLLEESVKQETERNKLEIESLKISVAKETKEKIESTLFKKLEENKKDFKIESKNTLMLLRDEKKAQDVEFKKAKVALKELIEKKKIILKEITKKVNIAEEKSIKIKKIQEIKKGLKDVSDPSVKVIAKSNVDINIKPNLNLESNSKVIKDKVKKVERPPGKNDVKSNSKKSKQQQKLLKLKNKQELEKLKLKEALSKRENLSNKLEKTNNTDTNEFNVKGGAILNPNDDKTNEIIEKLKNQKDIKVEKSNEKINVNDQNTKKDNYGNK